MGGRIDVWSEHDMGACFLVSLTFDVATDTGESPPAVLDGIKVLLFESDRDAARIFGRYLTEAGAEVIPAAPDLTDREIVWQLGGATAGGVLVIGGHQHEVEALAGRLRALTADEIAPGLVRIIRGRRRLSPAAADDELTLDANALRRSTLLNAVANAAGRASVDVGRQRAGAQSLAPVPIEQEPEQNKHRVLVAEDNPTNRRVIAQQLDLLGCTSVAAEDGALALELWRAGDFQLVLVDCHMPRMDGYELARQIRREEPVGHIPIVAITADALKSTAKRCYQAGMDGYLSKPMQLHQLKEMLDKWLPRTRALRIEATSPGATPVETGAVDPKALSEILGTSEPDVLLDFYQDFLRTANATRTELAAAHASGDSSEIRRLAHKLKSAARAVGAAPLFDSCETLESAGKSADRSGIDAGMAAFELAFDQVEQWIDRFRGLVDSDA